ncbi:autotransporter domain-containing protein [Bradyrhizobium sp. U87765 SZCCT0131]|uniref:autotransporter domain-containing protein n=1 Tax=unclassified Bradyrhizobium TaxID=2631580 RepID=UPI001BAAE8FC|nr:MULTISPECIES: autotransporter domain-containing protein [unclassified Bradyrhizobium]MBR1221841.1 autotransporter domain-containing protein [Bradyrhizobium sp. U87765 SZCCT0131]MBR1263961.1 autotransporter domain-containing protein [Bradyrhizobium sp. U87765 SZCCT0134]MBR1308256.1 autotransporter domain-containing protein [Bradyrhizobium sp. U87765 SZCCT0110]MBR1320211.1 autotransporter domain-containing protein [Bradyrhizobium sp. U87765 SZCCT0109]MBR1348676.1 autotransporter domain-contai
MRAGVALIASCFLGCAAAHAQCAGNTCTVTIASDPGTTSDGTTGAAGTLSYALAYANAQSSPVTINIATSVTLSGALSPILNSVTINGNGNTISGSGSQRIFLVGVDSATQASAAVAGSIVAQTQNVALNNLTLANAVAQGGAGGGGGGGGMGAGGALFVNQSGNVTLSGVSFSSNSAIGGAGATGTSGGGGGLGGAGGATNSSGLNGGGGGGLYGAGGGGSGNGSAGGGGVFGAGGIGYPAGGGGGGYTGAGGSLTANGQNGGLGIGGLAAQRGGNGYGTTGGAQGGGGGGSGQDAFGFGGSGGGGFGGQAGNPTQGGNGGFGGGGGGPNGTTAGTAGGFGGGGSGAVGFVTGGKGGFGGGGGGIGGNGFGGTGGNGGYGGGGGAAGFGSTTGVGGNGGFGAGGGSGPIAGQAGFGAGNGGSAAGGGGGAMGGAVFVAKGGTLTINGSGGVTGNTATGGSGANTGSAFGAGFFLQGSALTIGAGNYTISDAIADQNGSGGAAAADGLGGTGGQSALTKSGSGTLTLSGANTFSGGTTINEGSTLVVGNSQALGSGTLALNGGAAGVTVNFNGSFVIGNSIVATGDPTYNVLTGSTTSLTGVLSGSGDVVVNAAGGYAGTLVLSGLNTYRGPTTVIAGTLQAGSTSAFGTNSAMTVAGGAVLDLSGFSNAVGSLTGSGTVTNSGSAAILTAGGDNTSTVFSGLIQNGAGTTGLTKTGSGVLDLTGVNTYSGATTVSAGILQVDGSTASSSLTTVASGAVLSGSGTVGATTIAGGGILAPGNGSSVATLAVGGNLALQSGAIYLALLTPAAASRVAVTGTATINGATLGASFTTGSYVAKRYTILTATGGVSGTFGTLATLGTPANFRPSLSYDANDVYLDLSLRFALPSGLNRNQQQVADALTGFFNATGGIAAAYGALTPMGLTQASGETVTGVQQTTFNAMNQFLGLLGDPFVDGRGTAGGAPLSFADDAMAYAGARRGAAEREALGMITKAPPQDGLVSRWNVWAAGYGGTQTTDGNGAVGSNTATSRVFGTAVGADYRFSPNTVAGFALAGGGTSFSVANGGSGRSDLFQAGAFVRHTMGAAYLSGALAYGWQDVTINRTVTAAGADQLQGRFNADTYAGRIEGGYRVAMPWLGGVGLTPYVAGQFTTIDLPASAERVIAGSTAFALNYNGRSVTDTRSELGLRTDRSFALGDAILTLRGRAAWAHDFNPDRAVAATFQALPGASFVVNGAAQARDAALTTAAAEIAWRNGWSASATFDGEFSNVSRSYAGKGVVRYAW